MGALNGLLIVSAVGQPPLARIVGSGPGLRISFNTGTDSEDHYGLRQYATGSWAITDGVAANTSDAAFLRYGPTLKDQTSVSALASSKDWVVRVVWKQTNSTQTTAATVFEIAATGGDILAIRYTSQPGRYELFAGNGSGSYISLGTFALAVQEFHILTVHYRSATQTLDFWADRTLMQTGFVGRNGVYGLNFIQLRGGTSSNVARDHFDLVEMGEHATGSGGDWTRQHELLRMGLCLNSGTFDIQPYLSANFSHMLTWDLRSEILTAARTAALPNVARFSAPDGPTDFFKNMVRSYVQTYPNIAVFFINDEPATEALMMATGQTHDWLRSEFPDKLVLSNAGGEENYAAHIQRYLALVRPDVMMYDMYPFFPNDAPVPDYFWQWMSFIRSRSLAAGVPYWTFLQTFQRSDPQYGQMYRLPSESDIRMQMFASLTYGFTGVGYFCYDYIFDRGMLETNRTPNALYGYVAAANIELRNLGACLRSLTSTHVFYVRGQDTAIPGGLAAWSSGQVSGDKIIAIHVLDFADPRAHGLIGYFRDDAGQRYFMLTNVSQGQGSSAASRTVRFQIVFDPNVQSVLRVNRLDGTVERLAVVDAQEGLTISLPGGTGDLFKYDTGSMVGIPAVTGTVMPLNYPANLTEVGVVFEFRQGDNLIGTKRAFLDSTGRFELPGVPKGTYNVSIKTYAHLQKAIDNVTIEADPSEIPAVLLKAGNVDGDNAVTSSDLVLVLSHMNEVGVP